VPDGLFTQRPSAPPFLDLDALVHTLLTERQLAAPCTWTIVPHPTGWAMLVFTGAYSTPDGAVKAWHVRWRVPMRTLEPQAVAAIEDACLAVEHIVTLGRQEGFTFWDPQPTPTATPSKRPRRRRDAHA
jgi:hypothetical protein